MPGELAYRMLRPLLFQLPAETAHNLTLSSAAFIANHPSLLSVVRAWFRRPKDPILSSEVFGLPFEGPVGLAAGLDKNGVAIDFWAALGFDFVEVGTVTPGRGQPGNDPPRMARVIDEQAIINRMGFNNRGAEALAEALAKRRSRVIVGGNIGKAKETPLERAAEDYERALEPIWRLVDYVVVNVSSPNTPGLRSLQSTEALRPLLSRVLELNRRRAAEAGLPPKPVLLKVAPDLHDEDLDVVAGLALEARLSGLIATNTTLDKSGLRGPPPLEGGLSGAPLAARALACTKRLYRATSGRIPIVGVGGIHTAEEGYLRVRAGASLLQVYTGLVYQGPGLVSALGDGLASLLRRDGFGSIAEAVGVDAGRS